MAKSKVNTISQLFRFAITHYNKPNLIRYRGEDGLFYNISTSEFMYRVMDFSLGLRETGVKAAAKVALFSKNQLEWYVADLACHLLNTIVVPVRPAATPAETAFILNDSEFECLIIFDEEQRRKIDRVRDRLQKVKEIIMFEPGEDSDGVISFEAVLEKGREVDRLDFLDQAVRLAHPDEMATLIYTARHNETPKGIMLSHQNIISSVLALDRVLNLHPLDSVASFIPTANVFAKILHYVCLYSGATILNLGVDFETRGVQSAAPTIIVADSEFFELLKTRIEADARQSGGLRRNIFNWSERLRKKASRIQEKGRWRRMVFNTKNRLADYLVYSHIREKFGHRVKYLICAGPQLNQETAAFYDLAGLKLLEGYWRAEAASAVTLNPPGQPKPGTAGRALPDLELRLAKNGEIVIKGPGVMMGYYKKPEETEVVLAGDGFHTGDVGYLDHEGYLTLVQRQNNHQTDQ